MRNRRARLLIAPLALVAALFAAPVPASAAPAQVSTTPAVSMYQTSYGGDDADVYYPSGGTGLPVALLLQGAKVDRAQYAQYASAIARQGFVVVVPNHYRLMIFEWERYAAEHQVTRTVDWMKDTKYDASSPLYKRIDSGKMVLLGHSFGGAAGLAAAEDACSTVFCPALSFDLPSQVKAASFYGTNNAFLGIFADIDNQIPVQLVQGTADGIAPPSDAEQTYNHLENTPKQIVRLANANHYGITDVQSPSPAESETSAQSLTQAQSIEASARWAGRFLRAALGDAGAADYVWNTGDAADPGVTVTGAH
ncbi:poly(ethylene terephthalate) hydrolase family protein [Streptomyces sp. OR43]|uniref:poly(ethylene terephthalate) hydrolase family protein n=1 Tax=Streptomyces sp. or43 TaxID=2478957 RepID=UPI0011CE35EF|nr:dienelactone hydrolase family protein [Streptomyces sp. or43]